MQLYRGVGVCVCVCACVRQIALGSASLVAHSERGSVGIGLRIGVFPDIYWV